MTSVRFQKATYQTYGDLPPVGSAAPDFSLVATDLQDVTLGNWTGLRKVLNIFVSIDTEVCAKSVLAFDRYASQANDVAMLMVSYDLPFAHQRFGEQHELENTAGLSAIRHAGFGQNYGVEITDGPLAGMFARAVLVLDENNTVVYSQMIEDIATEPDYVAVFRALGIEIDE